MKRILVDECKYRGSVITDDLDMKAMAKHYDAKMIPVRALQAGADILLYCNEPESPPKALDSVQSALASGKLKASELESIAQKIVKFKFDKIKSPEPLPLEQALQSHWTFGSFKIIFW